MKTIDILYNPSAGSGWDDEKKQKVINAFPDSETIFYDIRAVDCAEFFKHKGSGDAIAIVGGDGTLNKFVNATRDIEIDADIYYLASGTGNDFSNDIGGEDFKPVKINKYIKDLPSVTVNGKTYSFINGVGYGIDGYCCEVGDAQKANGVKDVNYTGIAIKGLLFHFHPANATVTVDGKKYEFKKVWLAPAMFGRYYGGGMIPTPAQDRNSEDHRLSVLVWHGSGKLRTLIAFPSIFKGEHVKHQKMCTVLTGKKISVEFDRPCALQIDGETILGVKGYDATSEVTVCAGGRGALGGDAAGGAFFKRRPQPRPPRERSKKA